MTQGATTAYTPTSWWQRHVSKEADRDVLKLGERIGNIVAIVIIMIIAWFFLDIEFQKNAFFTSSFGPVEQFLFYGTLLYGIVPSLVRAITGRKNLGRFADLFGTLFGIVAISYFLVVFPFDFSYLVTLLPANIQPSFSWFTNDLVKMLFTIGLVISIIALVYNAILFFFVRRELKARRAGMNKM
jgi:flagellar biosynthesis protein FlhB